MKLPSFKRLNTKDYKEEFKDLIDKLSLSLNQGIESLYDAVNKKLTLRDNISCTVKDITVIVDSSGLPTADLIFALGNSLRIDGVSVIRVENKTNPETYPSNGVFATYTQSGDITTNKITINHITGLTAGNEYSIRIVIYYQ